MAINIEELRDRARTGSVLALDYKTVTELLDRLEAAEKATDEIESLQRYRTAYNEWTDKTEWMQKSLPAKYLGMHRADALKDLVSELLDRLEAAEKTNREWLRANAPEAGSTTCALRTKPCEQK